MKNIQTLRFWRLDFQRVLEHKTCEITFSKRFLCDLLGVDLIKNTFVVIIFEITNDNLMVSVESGIEKHQNTLGICSRFSGKSGFLSF